MDIFQQTKELCNIYNIKPARSKGQNFLIKEDVYEKIIEASDLKKNDIVLEVGPGLGFLTAKLAEKAKRVIAVELDDKLAQTLRTGIESRSINNVDIVNKNILDLSSEILELKKYKIVANLPYNITSVFLRKFLSIERKPELMVLMLQKEVAKRICARAGDMSLLAVSVQFYSKPEIIQMVPKNFFWPEPKVDSAIIKLTISNERLTINEKDFFRLVKIGFSARRKMLKKNLANGYHIDHEEAAKKLKKVGFSEKVRAQELSFEDWKKLLKEFSN